MSSPPHAEGLEATVERDADESEIESSQVLKRAPFSKTTPLEELVQQTLLEPNCPYENVEQLTNENDPNALLFWAKTLAAQAKKVKSFYMRKGTAESDRSVDKFHWDTDQVVMMFMTFFETSVKKFTQAARLDPKRRFQKILSEVDPIVGNAPSPQTPQTASSGSPAPTRDSPSSSPSPSPTPDAENTASSSSSSSSSGTPEKRLNELSESMILKMEAMSSITSMHIFECIRNSSFPFLALSFEWGTVCTNFAKVLEKQRDIENAYTLYKCACELFQRVLTDDEACVFVNEVFNRMPKVFDRLAAVKPSSSIIREYCDYFLVQFSNIAMRGTIKDLSLRPLVSMVLSENRHIRESGPIDVVRHLASYFDTPIANEARQQLDYLESMLQRTAEKEAKLEQLLTPQARKRLDESGLSKEEIYNNIEVIIGLLSWQTPPCRVAFEPIPSAEPRSVVWITDQNPSKAFAERYKLFEDEFSPSAVYLAKRRSDRTLVAIKVLKNYDKYKDYIHREVDLLASYKHDNLAQLLDVYHWKDKKHNEVWIVMEYCDGGNLVDIIPVATMKESEIAYIVREALKALEYLHFNNRMHRDLTSDDILLNFSGDVFIADFEIWMGKHSERYWLAPEQLLSEPYPYGSEVDIWSLGCIVMEMADGYPPFSDLHALKEFFYIATRGAPPLSKPKRWSSEFKDFLAEMLNIDSKKRATATRLLQHPFLHKACTRDQFAEIIQLRTSWARW